LRHGLIGGVDTQSHARRVAGHCAHEQKDQNRCGKKREHIAQKNLQDCHEASSALRLRNTTASVTALTCRPEMPGSEMTILGIFIKVSAAASSMMTSTASFISSW